MKGRGIVSLPGVWATAIPKAIAEKQSVTTTHIVTLGNAAVAAQSRETTLAPIGLAAEPTQLVAAIKQLAAQAKSGQSTGGILLVKSAAEAIVYANRCPSLRAVVGTCLESVDQAMNAIAPNVLILEYPYKSLPQIRNLLARFVRGPRIAGEQVQHRLKELARCA